MKGSRLINRYTKVFPALLVASFVVALLSIRFGAVSIGNREIVSSLQKVITGSTDMSLSERIFIEIRLPRAILCVFVGASLAVGGVLMQGLFRNPIVEPGLVGTSSGAAFGAALYFVLGAAFQVDAGGWALPFAACTGGAVATLLVFLFSLSAYTGKSSISSLLLTGIAVNALFLSGVGFLSYIARDPQARSITFWNLGTLSGANWHSVAIVGTSSISCIVIALRYAKQLNALMLGEEEAQLLGVNMKWLKINVLVVNVAMVAIATAFVGVISFVGLIVPHLLRIAIGSDNRFLIISSALLGGILLGIADLTARLVLMPAELPIGIVMAVVGAPVFISLLRSKNYYF